LPDIVVVVSEEPHGGKKFQCRTLTRHPCAELPDDRRAQAPIPAVLSNIERLAAVVLADGHRQIDEQVDRTFLEGLRTGDLEPVFALGGEIYGDGTSEMKNWIPVAAAMAELGLPAQVLDYVPCYRTEAGTGNAMAFVYWQ